MQKIQIIMYHYVREVKASRYPQIKGLEVKHFKRQIDFLKNHFQIVTMEEVLEAAESGRDLPENAVLLTFDDGYIDHFQNVFPILKNEGLQGSFFIPGKTFVENKLLDVNKIHFILASVGTERLLGELRAQMDYYRGREFDIPGWDELFEKYAVKSRFDTKETIFIKRCLQTVLPERLRGMISSNLFQKFVYDSEEKFAKELYMNMDQLKCMKRSGMFIGPHGYDHYWLGNIEEGQMQEDIDKSLEVLGGLIDQKCWVMNYPYGSYSARVIDYIKRRECGLGLATEVRKADLSKDNRFALPRLDTNDFPPKSNGYLKY